MKRRLLISAAMAAAVSAHGADVPANQSQSVIPVCDGSGSLVLVANNDDAAHNIAGLVDAALRGNTSAREQVIELLKGELCARRGPHEGAWLFAGTQAALKVGVVPMGTGSALLFIAPRHDFITLREVRFEAKK